jgi:hypothetical protein
MSPSEERFFVVESGERSYFPLLFFFFLYQGFRLGEGVFSQHSGCHLGGTPSLFIVGMICFPPYHVLR